MADDSIVTLGADLSAMRRELAQMPNIADKEAQAMLVKLETAVRSAEKAAKAAAKASGKAFADTQRKAKATSETIGDLGGELAKFGGMLSLPGLESAAPAVVALGDSIELLASPLGVAVGAIAGFGAALGVAVAGSVSLVSASDEMLARLDEIGRASIITPEQTEQLADARDALEGIQDVGTEIGIVMAAEVGPAVESAAELIVGVMIRAREATEATAAAMDVAAFGARVLAGVLAGPGALALADATGLTEAATEAAAELVSETREQGAAYVETTSEARQLAAAEDAVDRPRHAAATREQTDAARALADALRDLGQIQAAHAEQAVGLEAAFAEIDAIDALARAHAGSADVQEAAYAAVSALAAANEREAEAIHERELERLNEQATARQAALDQIRAAGVEATAIADRVVDDVQRMQIAAIAAAGGYLDDSFGQLAGGVSELTAAMAESGKLTEKAAMNAYKVSKAAGLAQVAINTAVAISKALAELGPILGPIAAIGLGASGAAQAAAIMATPPPAFYVGGVVGASGPPDATLATLHRGERVQTAASARREGVSDPAASRAANAGRRPADPVVVQVTYGGRALDTVIETEARRPGSGLRKATGTPRLGQRVR